MISHRLKYRIHLAACDFSRLPFSLASLFTIGSLCWAMALPASAHEFWVEPESFRPQPGAPFYARVLVGEDFHGDGVIYLPETFERFVTMTARGKQDIKGIPGDDPAARITAADPGHLLIVYQSTRFSLSIDGKTFEEYLKKEGLEGIRTQRSKAGKSDKSANEVYTRYAKSLLTVGRQSDGLNASQPAGLKLEIVPLTPIYQRAHTKGEEIEVQLLYENQPLAGVQIEALSKKSIKNRILQRTDQEGRARFTLPHNGAWLLNAVHMIPAPASANADWESFWASFTFEW